MLRQLTFKVSDTRDLQTRLQSSSRYDLGDVFLRESKPLTLLLSPEEKVQASVIFFFFSSSFFLGGGVGVVIFFLGGGGEKTLKMLSEVHLHTTES